MAFICPFVDLWETLKILKCKRRQQVPIVALIHTLSSTPFLAFTPSLKFPDCLHLSVLTLPPWFKDLVTRG